MESDDLRRRTDRAAPGRPPAGPPRLGRGGAGAAARTASHRRDRRPGRGRRAVPGPRHRGSRRRARRRGLRAGSGARRGAPRALSLVVAENGRVDEPLLAQSVGDLLDAFAEPTPAPAGGSAAALAVSMGAALLSMAARISIDHWAEAGSVAAQAEALRLRTAPLAQADAEAYAEVLRLRRERAGDAELGRAFDHAAEVPLRIAEAGADVAELAAYAAPRVKPSVEGDTAAAAVLAHAGAVIAAQLVAINLATSEGDERIRRAEELAAAAADAAGRAVA
ncbi:MAG: cyclodeaminase/cyclohydrolase family protein [Actinobacteria bacterium]|nr:MAG: cyclodeaminase/cyclohydrolase family protein [Actinomycetota bacterium]